MLRGTQKKVIRIRGGGSALFEEAIFIMKDGLPATHRRDEDMVSEANRLINENDMCVQRRRKRETPGSLRAGFWRCFLSGAAVGGALIGTLLFLIR